MKIQFRQTKLNARSLQKLEKINSIIEMYSGMGYTLTLRQLYYRLVIDNTIPNSNKAYAQLIRLLTEGRMAGIVDWDGIEDRVRIPYLPYFNTDTDDAIKDAMEQYRLDRQEGQKNHIELWVEKDAISNILKVRTHYYGIHLMVNRGFSSTTAMYAAYERIERATQEGKKPYILYLGDHDPSGLCMALRDIPDRLNEEFKVDVSVEHIGITMPQIKKYNPPTNPAKLTDSRSKWYIEKWGDKSWEVDALEPAVLHTLINGKIEELMDMKLFNKILEKEKEDREYLKNVPVELKRIPNIELDRDKLIGVNKSLNDSILVINKERDEANATVTKLRSDLLNKQNQMENFVAEAAEAKRIAIVDAHNGALDKVISELSNTKLGKSYIDHLLKLKK